LLSLEKHLCFAPFWQTQAFPYLPPQNSRDGQRNQQDGTD
jgi:hypothetical protein